jgi:hypothetical protein
MSIRNCSAPFFFFLLFLLRLRRLLLLPHLLYVRFWALRRLHCCNAICIIIFHAENDINTYNVPILSILSQLQLFFLFQSNDLFPVSPLTPDQGRVADTVPKYQGK